jgi:hypothetical protein
VWAHSAAEAEEIINGDGDHEDQPWYVEPETIGSMHILSQVEEIVETPPTALQQKINDAIDTARKKREPSGEKS